jgi:hypothetical protein
MSLYDAELYFEQMYGVSEQSMPPFTVGDDPPSLIGSRNFPFKQRIESSHRDERHSHSLHSSHIRNVPDPYCCRTRVHDMMKCLYGIDVLCIIICYTSV